MPPGVEACVTDHGFIGLPLNTHLEVPDVLDSVSSRGCWTVRFDLALWVQPACLAPSSLQPTAINRLAVWIFSYA